MEIKRDIIKYKLDFDKTISYFIEHIECGKTLAKTIVNKVNFKKGTFFTLLPSNVEKTGIYDFTEGIIPPIPYGEVTYKINGVSDNFQPQQVITMDFECSEFIFSYIHQDNKNYAIVENYMYEPNSPHANIKNVKRILYEDEVYYFLRKKNSIEEIYETIRKSSLVWHTLFVLTKINRALTLDNATIDNICGNAEFVIASAYDGEGYIFWEKK